MKASLCRDNVHNCPFPSCRDDVKIVCRDADERCSEVIPRRSKTFKAALQCIRDQRIRKFKGPRYVKVDTGMKDGERSHTGGHKLDGLGFALEPNPTSAPPPLCPDDPLFLLPCSTSHLVTRYSALPSANPAISDTSPTLQVNKLNNFIEKINDLISQKNPDSTAMVTMSAEALAVGHVDGKCRQSELVHHRIRRPFIVSEVEALVHAVEKLGTGRWHDVKLRAFDNARRRTYVDLKDKWKTLVHTVRISPQQRRGLPVPQELLDRVLSAHAY
ncbi:hypothetical protein GIB67_002382 [Kingdonia uniflora]|uniref:Uncharacterized protein n=1 Tax=Kingdonia uniflora TaxID=39325 RepID=A0A7J7M8M0_9MAGN|nr:hypothetical protein GIB67_002382 [Kingdonia uniflora]